MVNYNGELFSNTTKFLNQENRGLRYGDALFESIRFVQGHIPFWEDHYLRLMSSMRMLRMEIPMNFTMEFLQEQIVKTVEANNLQKGARMRVLVFRDDGGLYTPLTNTISYIIQAEPLESPFSFGKMTTTKWNSSKISMLTLICFPRLRPIIK